MNDRPILTACIHYYAATRMYRCMESWCNQAISRYPGEEHFHLYQGLCLSLLHRIRECINELTPLKDSPYPGLAASIILLHASADASQEAEIRVKRNNASDAAIAKAAHILLLLGRIQEANEYIDLVLSRSPSCNQAIMTKTWIDLMVKGHHDMDYSLIDSFIAASAEKQHPESQLLRAMAYTKRNQFYNALTCLDRLLYESPSLHAAHVEKVRAGLAISDWNSNHQQYLHFLDNLSISHSKRIKSNSQPDLVIDIVRAYMDRAPSEPPPKSPNPENDHIPHVLVKAEQLLEPVLFSNFSDSNLLYHMSWIKFLSGHAPNALKIIDRCIDNDNSFAIAYLMKAWIELHSGHINESNKSLEQALTLANKQGFRIKQTPEYLMFRNCLLKQTSKYETTISSLKKRSLPEENQMKQVMMSKRFVRAGENTQQSQHPLLMQQRCFFPEPLPGQNLRDEVWNETLSKLKKKSEVKSHPDFFPNDKNPMSGVWLFKIKVNDKNFMSVSRCLNKAVVTSREKVTLFHEDQLHAEILFEDFVTSVNAWNMAEVRCNLPHESDHRLIIGSFMFHATTTHGVWKSPCIKRGLQEFTDNDKKYYYVSMLVGSTKEDKDLTMEAIGQSIDEAIAVASFGCMKQSGLGIMFIEPARAVWYYEHESNFLKDTSLLANDMENSVPADEFWNQLKHANNDTNTVTKFSNFII